MASIVKSFATSGVDGYVVDVEVSVIQGLPMMSIVGLGDTAVKEARERVQAAINDSGHVFPSKKIVINLAPSYLKKSGSHFDLAIAIGLLEATNRFKKARDDVYAFIGELSLDAKLRAVSGVLPMIMAAKASGLSNIIVPLENVSEASLVKGVNIFGFGSLTETIEYLEGKREYDEQPVPVSSKAVFQSDIDFKDVQGQEALIEFVVIAAAGGHNMLMVGQPGCGKSMIAKRIPTILPSMSEEEALEVTKIHSVAGILKHNDALIQQRPFRAPHHNASTNSLIGGGHNAMPGEISLSHNGVLFLDEMTEFDSKTLNALRQPMEDGHVTVSRVKQSNTYPSSFMLIAAMNPCSCGYYGSAKCRCTDYEVQKYRQKLSGPILDRIDIQKYVKPVDFVKMSSQPTGVSSAELKERVNQARAIQKKRFKDVASVNCNAQMNNALLKEHCLIEKNGQKLMELAYGRFKYSARTFHKYLKVARTFADMDGAEKIRESDIAATLMCRDLDKDQTVMAVL